MPSRYAFTVYAAPATEPLTVAEAKAHLRLEHAGDDDLVSRILTAAREDAEAFLSQTLVSTTLDVYWDHFPGQGDDLRGGPGYAEQDRYALVVPRSPLVSVTHLKYTNTAGTLTTLTSGADYTVDAVSNPGRIVPYFGTSWPTARAVPNAVTARVVCGYGAAASVPSSIKSAILLIVGALYEHREEFVTGTIVTRIPTSAESLLWKYRSLAA